MWVKKSRKGEGTGRVTAVSVSIALANCLDGFRVDALVDVESAVAHVAYLNSMP
jgi:hypothetical protein